MFYNYLPTFQGRYEGFSFYASDEGADTKLLLNLEYVICNMQYDLFFFGLNISLCFALLSKQ